MLGVFVFIGVGCTKVSPENGTLGDLLDEKVKQENLHFKFDTYTSLGRYILEIGNLVPGSNQWIEVCSTIDDLQYSNIASSFTFEGVEYFVAIVGIDSLPRIKGAKYLFKLNNTLDNCLVID